MNIAVLIKQVPVSNDVSVDPETHALVRASSEGMINPADLNAIEEAMQLKEQTDGKVVVFTMGPPDAEKALRDAMALGCDESCLITDRAVAGGDTVATAKVLAKAIRLYGEFRRCPVSRRGNRTGGSNGCRRIKSSTCCRNPVCKI